MKSTRAFEVRPLLAAMAMLAVLAAAYATAGRHPRPAAGPLDRVAMDREKAGAPSCRHDLRQQPVAAARPSAAIQLLRAYQRGHEANLLDVQPQQQLRRQPTRYRSHSLPQPPRPLVRPSTPLARLLRTRGLW